MKGKGIISFEIVVDVKTVDGEEKSWRLPELGQKSAAKALRALIAELEQCGEGTATFYSNTVYPHTVALRNQSTPVPVADVIVALRKFALELEWTPELTL